MTDVRNFSEISKALLSDIITVDEPANAIQTRLYKMIDYAKDRYHWYEDQRERRLSLALAMITLSSIVMGIIVGSTRPGGIDPSSLVFKVSTILLLSISLTAFSVIIIYLRGQNLSYTHRKSLTSIFSWYNYGVPKDNAVGAAEYLLMGKYSSLITSARNEPALDVKRKAVSDGYEKFSREVVKKFSSTNESFDEDMQQVYILQIFQIIARDNLRLMTAALRSGVIVIGILTIVLTIAVIFVGVPTLTGTN